MNQIILKHLIFQCILILYYLTPENNSCQSFSFDDMGFVECSLENSSEILNHTDKVPVSTLHLTIADNPKPSLAFLLITFLTET